MKAASARKLIDVLHEDRRSETSRANLEQHIPQALDPAGTLVVSVRLPVPAVEAMDNQRGDRTRSEYVRELIR